ncbi:hypothetical protein GGI12_003559 [Dipsacomyces acuminosporus]|nr:hypothetical protein GGI12_003559 [Dipsacomyces acuminosporus]
MSLPRPSSSLVVTAPLASIVGRTQTAGTAFNYGVLMAKRIDTGSFHSAYVFPGGVEDKEDGLVGSYDPRKVCAIRETFEETGLLLCEPASLDTNALRSPGSKGSIPFHELCAKHGLKPLDVKQIGRWITPRAQKKRFDTRFYMLNVGDGDAFLTGQLKHSAVQPSELVCLDWFTPDEVLQANARSEMPLFPPQFCVLKELSRYTRWQDLAANAASFHLSNADAPIEPILGKRSDGTMVALLPGDRAYRLPKDAGEQPQKPADADLFVGAGSASSASLHRIEMALSKSGGGFMAANLMRTIDAHPKL